MINWAYSSTASLIPLLQKCQSVKDFELLLTRMVVVGVYKDSFAVRNIVTHCSARIKGSLKYAELLLKQVYDPNPFIWNTVIRGYDQRHNSWKAIHLYREMLRNSFWPDKFTFPIVLKSCANICALEEGEQVHCRILKSPHKLDMFVQDSLILMYSKCGKIEAAHFSFDAMAYKNLISWNIMIDSYVKRGETFAARQLFDQMPTRDLFSWNVMIDGYAKCGQIEAARWLFDEMPIKDIVSWNSMIDGYAKGGNMGTAKELFDQMPLKDEVTWGIMLNGYSTCGYIELAHSWFEKTPYRVLITWNSLIRGYARCNSIRTACILFDLMPIKSLTSYNIMLDAFVKCREIKMACQLFCEMPIKDVFSWNIMIDGHAAVGDMKSAQELFDAMPHWDVVSWNVLIVGYKQSGHSKKAIELYFYMQLLGEKPDCSTLATVLSAIADLGLFLQGMQVHSYVEENNFPIDGIIGVALIDMYSKCGYVETALRFFESIPHKTRDHWNSMISGVAIYGYGSLAISLFKQMEQSMVEPDDITFIAVLNACSHSGLVHEGQLYFDLMDSKYMISPKIHHYGCMVDLLSRAGHLEMAMALVTSMPVRPNDVVWRALLGASRNHGNIEIAEHAAKHLIELVPHDSSSYVLLSNIYGYRGRCECAREMRKMMKDRGVVKNPGWSSIELHGIVHKFTVGDTSHTEIIEIHLLLNKIAQELMVAGYVPNTKFSLFDTDV